MYDFLNKSVFDGTFIVVDFETVTPSGRSPEPMELAGMIINVNFKVDLENVFNSLMKIPGEVYLTSFDTSQTGILQKDVDGAQSQIKVFENFENFIANKNFVFVAQNANYEAKIFHRFKDVCKVSSKRNFIDTIKIAKYLYPGLPNYKLDTLSNMFMIPTPPDRHRALPDVKMTVRVFLKLMEEMIEKNKNLTMRELIQIGGIATQQDNTQMSLF